MDGSFEIIDDLHGLFHLLLVVEVHFEVHTIATDIVEQRTDFVERHPAGHDALAAHKNLAVEVKPFGGTALWLSYAGSPLYGIEFLDFEQGGQMVHGSHAIEMIERVVYLLTLLADERLYEPAIVVLGNHGRDVALQFRHLARCPRREIAEGHLVALADNVVEFVEHSEIDVVNLLHLVFQHFRLHHRVEKHLVGAFHGRQHIEAFHQVGHAHIVVPLCLFLAGFQQLFVEQPVGMVLVEMDVVGVVGVGMYPDGILTALEDTAQDGSQGTRSQLGVSHRQHVGHQ